MLIIAGALLLVCGGLMLGGGLMLRAKTPVPLVAASASEPIAWLFEHPSLPIDERSVFVFDATPDGLRIKGFAIGGVNLSEETLGALGGVIKPDGRDQDLDLALSVEKPEDDAHGAHPSPWPCVAEGAIPPQAPFRLVFLFPAEGEWRADAATGDLDLWRRDAQGPLRDGGQAEIVHPISADRRCSRSSWPRSWPRPRDPSLPRGRPYAVLRSN